MYQSIKHTHINHYIILYIYIIYILHIYILYYIHICFCSIWHWCHDNDTNALQERELITANHLELKNNSGGIAPSSNKLNFPCFLLISILKSNQILLISIFLEAHLKLLTIINVGKTILNHPQIHHR